MEKILCLLLTFCLTFSLAACGNDGQQDNSGQDAAGGSESVTQPAENGDDGALTAENADKKDGSVSDEYEDKADAKDSEKADEADKSDQTDTTKKNGTSDTKADKTSKKDAKKDTQASAKPASNKKPENSGSSSKPVSKPASKPSTKPAADKSDAKTPKSALNLLNTVWGSYKEAEKFPAAGGDFSEANTKDGAPGKFSISDKDTLQSTLAVPAGAAGKLSSAASLMHMMNLNTFTAASFKIKDKGDVKDFAKEMKGSLETRRWVCGFPDKFVIITVDKYVVSVFGAADLVDTFKAKTLKAYSSAKVYCDQDIE